MMYKSFHIVHYRVFLSDFGFAKVHFTFGGARATNITSRPVYVPTTTTFVFSIDFHKETSIMS